MVTVTIHEAKTHLSKVIARAEAGEEIVIARGKEPVVRLAPVQKPKPRPQRAFGKGSSTYQIRSFLILYPKTS